MKRTSAGFPSTQLCLALLWCLVSTDSSAAQDDLFGVPQAGNAQAQTPLAQDPPSLPGGMPNFQAPDTSLSPMDPYIPEQKNEVNEKFAGWREAGEGNNIERLADGLRANWVMSDRSGRIDGTISTYGKSNLLNMRVSLLNNGRVISQTKADAFGRFRFNNVRPGTYTLAGFGDSALFVFGFNVLAFDEAAQDRTPTSIDVMAVPNETTINLDWIRYFAPQVVMRVYGRYVSDDEYNNQAWEASKLATGLGMLDGEAELASPERLYGVKGLSSKYPECPPATSIGMHSTNLTDDGRLVGRVHQVNSLHGRPVELRNTRVMLLKDDGVVTAETTDNYGVFELLDVDPGQYALVAVGEDGMGCIGIEVTVGAEKTLPIDFTMATAESVGWLNNLAVATAYNRVINRPRPEVVKGNQCGCGGTDLGRCGGCQGCGAGCGNCNQGCNSCNGGVNGSGSSGNCRRVGAFWRFIDAWSEAYYYDIGPTNLDTSCRNCGPELNGTRHGLGCQHCSGNGCNHCRGSQGTGVYTPVLETPDIQTPTPVDHHGAFRTFVIPNRLFPLR
ncbi:MAG: hypothetical protein VYE64_08955 [Planctomycetota bacterium]|nr:hypothetical protein [Planctomycetota bacterium]